MGQALQQQWHQVQFFHYAVLRTDLYDTPVHCGGTVVLLHVIPRDQIDDDIGPFAIGGGFGPFDKIFGAIVDGDVGTQRQAGLTFLFRANGSDDIGAEGFGQQGGNRANA
ncbi:hypothetical protein D3C78_1417530 [compost metagenome]